MHDGPSNAPALILMIVYELVQGINFRKLHERHPDLEAGLVRAHEELVRLEQEEIRRGAVSSSADSMKVRRVSGCSAPTL